MLKTIIHVAAIVCFGIAISVHPSGGNSERLANNPVFKAMAAPPGKWKFLTVWDTVLQLVYHSIALLNDLAGSSEIDPKKKSLLQKLRDAIFASWAFPIGMVVSVTFWGLYAIDRALVFPKEVDEFYPNWLNHAVHTGPIAFILLDLLTAPKSYQCRKSLIIGNVSFIVVYLSWLTYVFTLNGFWAYPIFNMMNTPLRAVFFGGTVLFSVIYYRIGETLTKLRWGAVESAKASPKQQKGKGGFQGKKKKNV